MHSRTSILFLAAALAATLDASVRFADETSDFPDLDLSFPLLAEGEAFPYEPPRARGFLVSENGKSRFEDQYDAFELWSAMTKRARWRDADGVELSIARLTVAVPEASASTMTREEFYSGPGARVIEPRRDAALRDEAVYLVAPVAVGEPVRPRRAQRRNFTDLLFYPSTNDHAFVAAFRPRSADRRYKPDWYLVSLVCPPSENADEAFEAFDAFLDEIDYLAPERDAAEPPPTAETELLRRDLARSVANYRNWHFSTSKEAVVLDDLTAEGGGAFVAALTNELPLLQAAYARMLPTALSSDMHLAVARVFAKRADYVAYVGSDRRWSAAVWCPERRELVAFYPESGDDGLLRTVRHEALHQYLSYAASMVTAAPWFNEGHAELFEHTHFDQDGNIVFDQNPAAVKFVRVNAEPLAEYLPAFFMLDYNAFYANDGTAEQRQANYRIAWSVAYFLEVGAPNVRFRPFASLRADYLAHLLRTKDFAAATRATLTDDLMKKLIAEWLKFWTH